MPVPGLNPNIRLVPEAQEEINLDDIVVVNWLRSKGTYVQLGFL